MLDKQSGEIRLVGGTVFKWILDGKEIYGWVEDHGSVVKGTSGWFRTADPYTAVRAVGEPI